MEQLLEFVLLSNQSVIVLGQQFLQPIDFGGEKVMLVRQLLIHFILVALTHFPKLLSHLPHDPRLIYFDRSLRRAPETKIITLVKLLDLLF